MTASAVVELQEAAKLRGSVAKSRPSTGADSPPGEEARHLVDLIVIARPVDETGVERDVGE